jgi:hypothetical protein
MFSVYLPNLFSYSLPHTPNPELSSHLCFVQINSSKPLFRLLGWIFQLDNSDEFI